MSIDPKMEDISELAPHVAAIAAAYGDPTGKYAKFLERTIPNYQSSPFFFYDQTIALPASRMNGNAERRDGYFSTFFDCAGVLGGEVIELDNGVFATCAELAPLYGAV